MENQQLDINLQTSKLTNPLDEAFVGKYNGQELKIPAKKSVILPTVAAKVVGRHLITRVIQVTKAEEAKEAGVDIGGWTMVPAMRKEASVLVYGKEVDEFGNPPVLTAEQQAEEQSVKMVEVEDSEDVPVENLGWTSLVNKAQALGVFDKTLKRPQLEKAVKAAMESK